MRPGRRAAAVGAAGMLLAVLGIPLVPRAEALPAYSRLYQAGYGYRPSCAACHTAGGGSTVTGYGRDFLRAGANQPAFGKIEAGDSDGDGTANLAEITAKANPGDPRSTPTSLGSWLADAAAVPVPTEQLARLFPGADAFSAVEGTLSAAQVAVAEAGAGAGVALGAEDKLPTFYFAASGGKKIGVAQYVSAASAVGPISLAVTMDVGGTVTGVAVLKNPAAKGIEGKAFLAQFVGKRLADAGGLSASLQPAAGAEADSRAVGVAVAKAIAMINVVFSKG